MSHTTVEVVICGAGIAGIAAAYFLTVQQGIRDVVVVDERAPLSLTSDKSTECYRNWWPGPDAAMVQLMPIRLEPRSSNRSRQALPVSTGTQFG